MRRNDAGVIFDLDGVLIDSEGLHYQAYSEVLAPFGIRINPEEYGREWIAHGRGPEYAVEKYRLTLSPQEIRERKNPIYHRLLRSAVRLMPGAARALERLGAHFWLALATNSNEDDTGFVLDHFNLRRYFRAVVTRSMYERAKPEPDAFLVAAARLGLPPARCVVLEDTFRGITAAARAGCPCIAVPNELTRENDFTRASRVVSSLDEASVDLVEKVLGG
jgi:HAD superfamily hydrolase (TIGR01509 family)